MRTRISALSLMSDTSATLAMRPSRPSLSRVVLVVAMIAIPLTTLVPRIVSGKPDFSQLPSALAGSSRLDFFLFFNMSFLFFALLHYYKHSPFIIPPLYSTLCSLPSPTSIPITHTAFFLFYFIQHEIIIICTLSFLSLLSSGLKTNHPIDLDLRSLLPSIFFFYHISYLLPLSFLLWFRFILLPLFPPLRIA